ncbi:hypothetical protein F0344_15475 [Streptomyces finlayi]|uniref:Uncharacterized protein n=1 Tax=Streptomyces finlayi TaxID=67296 RepID=A0A7G7BKI2_9ACTN|nr:hypothetical protein [Streptomyces finlayi]QNE75847.1 hypothetical protein F0344_15475 [Streptomyces finlayi]
MLAEDRRHRDERRCNGGAGHIGARPQTAAQAAAVLALAARLEPPDRETGTRRLEASYGPSVKYQLRRAVLVEYGDST